MGWSEILGTLKGKVLDAANLELLEHTYELQERTIKQLESNNNALEKNKELLENVVKKLKLENRELTAVNEDYTEQLKGLEKGEAPMQEYSNNASAVLSFFLENDQTKGYELSIIEYLRDKGFSKIQIKGGIAELRSFNIILPWSNHPNKGPEWGLTDEGKMLLAR